MCWEASRANFLDKIPFQNFYRKTFRTFGVMFRSPPCIKATAWLRACRLWISACMQSASSYCCLNRLRAPDSYKPPAYAVSADLVGVVSLPCRPHRLRPPRNVPRNRVSTPIFPGFIGPTCVLRANIAINMHRTHNRHRWCVSTRFAATDDHFDRGEKLKERREPGE
jgi:hypothetical protein